MNIYQITRDGQTFTRHSNRQYRYVVLERYCGTWALVGWATTFEYANRLQNDCVGSHIFNVDSDRTAE